MNTLAESFSAPRAPSKLAQYVLAVARVEGREQVVAVRKNRPAWQAGRYNFPGGKIEAGESPLAAVARELGEETGVWLSHDAFRPVALVERPGEFEMFVFAAETDELEQARTCTDEAVELLNVPTLKAEGYPAIENLAWLYGMAFDGYPKLAHVYYHPKLTHVIYD